jgi:hypothetical protein
MTRHRIFLQALEKSKLVIDLPDYNLSNASRNAAMRRRAVPLKGQSVARVPLLAPVNEMPANAADSKQRDARSDMIKF